MKHFNISEIITFQFVDKYIEAANIFSDKISQSTLTQHTIIIIIIIVIHTCTHNNLFTSTCVLVFSSLQMMMSVAEEHTTVLKLLVLLCVALSDTKFSLVSVQNQRLLILYDC